jgi:hypothetical protein
MKRNLVLACLVLLVASAGIARADGIVNPGFENALNGWSWLDAGYSYCVATGSLTANGATYLPAAGDYFAWIQGTGHYIHQRDWHPSVVEKYSGWFAFVPGVAADPDAYAYVTIRNSSYEVLWSATTKQSAWVWWESPEFRVGENWVQYGIAGYDNVSYALFDGGGVGGPIPEPATMMLVGTGLVGAFLRRRKA